MHEQPVIEIIGSGPDLVMIHGWGSHKGIWGDFAEQLAGSFRLHLVDLPGHGDSSRPSTEFTASGFADAVAEQTPPATWLGSSLGGLITINAALKHPQNVKRMVLISTNPSFVATPDWPDGQEPGVFESFSKRLDSGVAETLKHFSKLEIAGSVDSRQTLRKLGRVQAVLPCANALRAGLEILRTEDQTSKLASITMPSLLIAGSEDRLVPVKAMRKAATLIPGAQIRAIEGAGHAPFVSHPELLYRQVSDFLGAEPGS